MTQPLTFLEFDSMLEMVSGTLIEVYAQIATAIKEAKHLSPEEKVRLSAQASDDLAERLGWPAPRLSGRPAKNRSERKEMLKFPYSIVLLNHQQREEGAPIDRYAKLLGGK